MKFQLKKNIFINVILYVYDFLLLRAGGDDEDLLRARDGGDGD